MNQRITTSEALSHAAGSPPRGEGSWAPWSLSNLAGRLVEVTGRARLTMACGVVLGAQQRHEPVAWVAASGSLFLPSDAAESGVDLDALPLVRVKSAAEAARAADLLLRSGAFGLVVLDLGTDPEIPIALQSRLIGLAQKHQSALLCLTESSDETSRAASRFGPTVAPGKDRDAGDSTSTLRGEMAEGVESNGSDGVVSNGTTPSSAMSSGTGSLRSLVSLRVEAWRRRDGKHAAQPEDRFACGVMATKDKSRGPGWRHEERFRGPPGLC